MAARSLRLYDSFSTWKDFHDAVELHLNSTYKPMTKASSKKVETHNKNVKDSYPLEMVYFYQSCRCSHRGTFKPRGMGVRETKSCREGCSAKIQASLDKKDKSKIVVTIMDERHNHDIGEHVYKRYPKNRCLQGEEKEQAAKLCALNVPNKDMRKELEFLTGKSVTLQDVHNVKRAYRRKEKETLCDGDRLNDAQILYKKVEMRKRTDPGMATDIGVNDSGELQYFFYADSNERKF